MARRPGRRGGASKLRATGNVRMAGVSGRASARWRRAQVTECRRRGRSVRSDGAWFGASGVHPMLALLRTRRLLAPYALPLLLRCVSTVPTPPALKTLVSPEDMDEARRWVERFERTGVPKSLVEVTFSRSSGPGGQVRCWNYSLTRRKSLTELA